MKRNIIKTMTREDKFARKYWCDNARRNYTKDIKKRNRKRFRRELKKNLLKRLTD